MASWLPSPGLTSKFSNLDPGDSLTLPQYYRQPHILPAQHAVTCLRLLWSPYLPCPLMNTCLPLPQGLVLGPGPGQLLKSW